MYRSLLPALSLVGSAPAAAQDAASFAARARLLTAAERCPDAVVSEVTVCARRDDRSMYRLPEGTSPPPGSSLREGGTAAYERLNRPGACAPFGERRCTRREAASQGYGGGRDPVTLAARVLGRLIGGE